MRADQKNPNSVLGSLGRCFRFVLGKGKSMRLHGPVDPAALKAQRLSDAVCPPIRHPTPNGTSLLSPAAMNLSVRADGMYEIYGFDASNNLMPLAHEWLGGNVFDFEVLGVSRFDVLGIDASAGLDPKNTTAFLTGLTFAGNETFTGTLTPLEAVMVLRASEEHV